MSLSQYTAYWLVARSVGAVGDPARPANRNLQNIDRLGLADAIVTRVGDLHLASDGDRVVLNRVALIAAAPDWATLFDVRKSILDSAVLGAAPASEHTNKAFADYILTRWIFRLVWRFEIAKLPLNRQLPPNYDGDARKTLKDALVQYVRKAGLQITDRGALDGTVSEWEWVSDVKEPFLTLTSHY
jgi:hypothetical protein